MRDPALVNGEFYHVYNRGVEKRTIFQHDRDYQRFLFHLFALNDRDVVPNHSFYANRDPSAPPERKERDLLVDILAFCFMPNHFHILVRQAADEGISLFMQKISAGYAKYFNIRYERTGRLFEGPFQAKHIVEDRYLRHLVTYIHLNPVDLFQRNWKEDGIRKLGETLGFLDRYYWSSHAAYVMRPEEEGMRAAVINWKLVGDLGLQTGSASLQEIKAYLGDRRGRGVPPADLFFD